MRVRFYAVGSQTKEAALRLDRFPVLLEYDPKLGLIEATSGHPGDFCLSEECGHLYLKTLNRLQIPRIDDAAMLSGVIDPGAHLQVGELTYLVSYERTGNAAAPSSRYFIQPVS